MKTTAKEIINILERHNRSDIEVAVETGTWQAKTTKILADIFKTVHTIELSRRLFKNAKKSCKGINNIQFHFGDSAKIVPLLAHSIRKPALFYLDAHWWATEGMEPPSRKNPFPLWAELGVLKNRPFSDIIIVDDVHAFGKTHRGPWAGVSIKTIADKFSNVKEAVIINDHCIVYRDARC